MRVLFLAAIGLLAACQPALEPGRFACADHRDCPSGWYCHADDRCYPDPADVDDVHGLDAGLPDGGEPAGGGDGDGGDQTGPMKCELPEQCGPVSGPHVLATCADGTCGVACEAHWADCDVELGCEALVETRARCGDCEHACMHGEHCGGGSCRTLAIGRAHTANIIGNPTDGDFVAARAAAVDSRGSLYVVGQLKGVLQLRTNDLSSTEAPAAFLLRYSASGSLNAARSFPGYEPTKGSGLDAITLDASDNVYVAGLCADHVSFGGGIYTEASGDTDDVCVASFAGEAISFRWQQVFGGTNLGMGFERPAEIAVTGSTVFVMGNFEAGQAGTQTMQIGAIRLQNAGGEDIYVVRLSAATGEPIGAERFGESQGQRLADSAVDPTSGDVLITGRYEGSFEMGDHFLDNQGGFDGTSDIFVARLRADGSVARAIGLGGPGSDDALGVAVAPDGTVWVAGSLDTTAGAVSVGGDPLHGPYGAGIFVAQFTPGLTHVASRIFGSTGRDGADLPAQADAACDDAGNFFVTASLAGDAMLDDRALTVHGRSDALLASFDAQLGLRYATTIGGANEGDDYGLESGQSIAVRRAGEPAYLLPALRGPAVVSLDSGELVTIEQFVALELIQ
jgi:hypothetical protein